MVTTAILFYDPAMMSTPLANAYISAVKVAFNRDINSIAVNFFSSKQEDLALVSRHRVVSLPTLVLLNGKNKVLTRCTTELPVPESLLIVETPVVEGDKE